VLRSGSSITYGGILNLVQSRQRVDHGASFKLFNASGYPVRSGSITSSDAWAGSNLGYLRFGNHWRPQSGGSKHPRITSISVSGTTLNISATNGVAGGQYVLLGSTKRGAALQPMDADIDQPASMAAAT